MLRLIHSMQSAVDFETTVWPSTKAWLRFTLMSLYGHFLGLYCTTAMNRTRVISNCCSLIHDQANPQLQVKFYFQGQQAVFVPLPVMSRKICNHQRSGNQQKASSRTQETRSQVQPRRSRWWLSDRFFGRSSELFRRETVAVLQRLPRTSGKYCTSAGSFSGIYAEIS